MWSDTLRQRRRDAMHSQVARDRPTQRDETVVHITLRERSGVVTGQRSSKREGRRGQENPLQNNSTATPTRTKLATLTTATCS